MGYESTYKVLIAAESPFGETPLRRRGESIVHHLRPMLDYFLMFAEARDRFPGFANEIQGVYAEEVAGRTRLFTYVVRE